MLDETHRLRALQGYDALDTPGEAAVDDIANAAARVCAAPMTDHHEARLLDALDSADLGWWDWDLVAGRIVINARMALIFGLAPKAAREGLDRTALMANVHPHDRPWLEQAISDACESGAPFQQEHRVLAQDGSVRWVSSRGRCLRDDRGLPTRFPGVAFDITAAKLTESRLHESEASREMALEAARLGRFDHDLSTGRRFYDARAQEMLGLSLSETQDIETLFSRLHPEDQDRVRAAQQAALNPERRGLYHEVYRTLGKDGEERWISGTGRSHFADGVCVRFMGVLEDVTEAKRAEAHRAMLTRELDHRVKNTLTLAASLVDASLRATPDSSTARPVIAARLGALGRAHDHLIAKEWTAATVSQIIHGVTQALSLPAERLHLRGDEIGLEPKPALQLTLALHELATNAIKYGALANAEGSVAMNWSVEPSATGQVFGFDWIERDGPRVSPPSRRGFGSRLIESVTAAQFAGSAVLEYAPDGVRWRLRAPYAGLAELGRHAAAI